MIAASCGGARERAGGLRQVGVGVAVARQHLAQHGHRAVGPDVRERCGPARRLAHLEADDAPAGADDASHLAEAELAVGEVADAPADRGRGELAVGERQLQRVALHPLDRRRLGAGDVQHLLREVEADHPPARAHGTAQLDGQVAGAAAHVQRGVARLQPRGPHGGLPPSPVHAEAHHPVHPVVGRRDPVEHLAHPLGLHAHLAPPHLSNNVMSRPRESITRPATKSTRSSIVCGRW